MRWRLALEAQESPLVCAVFLANNKNDSGAGSLGQAILDSNATLGSNIICFVVGPGMQTINPSSDLPTIIDPVLISGWQYSSHSWPGDRKPGQQREHGAARRDQRHRRNRLVNNRCKEASLWKTSDRNDANSCYIGLDQRGTSARSNQQGLVMADGATDRIVAFRASAGNVNTNIWFTNNASGRETNNTTQNN